MTWWTAIASTNLHTFQCSENYTELIFCMCVIVSRPQTRDTRAVLSIDRTTNHKCLLSSCHNTTALFSETKLRGRGQCPTCPYLVGQRQKVRGEWKCVRQNNAGSFCEIHWMASALSTSEHVVVGDGQDFSLSSLFPLHHRCDLRYEIQKCKLQQNQKPTNYGTSATLLYSLE